MDDEDVSGENILKLKLIVIGNQGTGKTCILNRFVNETFEENYQATIGLDFQSKNVTIHDQDVRLILYDTAGQEKFRALIPMYIRDASIILFIYDISDRESFDSIPKWIRDVLNVKEPEAILVLVGNKIDLENERKVTFEEGKKFADDNKYLFQEVSAKDGNNFNNLFEVQIFEAIYNKFQKEFDQREKVHDDEQGNSETIEYTNKTTEKKVKLEADNDNNKNVKKKKKCC